MVSDQYQTTVTKTFGQSLSGLSLSPTICRDGRVNVIPGQGHKISSVEVFDPAGRKIQNTSGAIPDGVLTISLPETRGTYLIRIRENGKIHHFKVFRF
jgi:hypothetical protein